ncbi:MAG: hypothetical protein KBD21_04835 [Candidatus Pacebacteria bacterium]|nr:hypothetical protein [Candidatus Paceibacterota bacterium]
MGTLAFQYLHWHYSVAVAGYWGILQNLIWFLYSFFSLELMVHTLFVPFHRLTDRTSHHGKLDVGAISEEILVNTLMRIVGFFLRSLLIAAGVTCIMCACVFGGFFFVVWLLAPLMLAILVTTGTMFILFA